MKKVVIIGGGISGLATAYFLQEEAKEKGIDLEYHLIEKNSRLGGNIITEKVDGFLVEGGPDSFLSQKPWALLLSKRLGLQPRLVNTNKDSQTFVLWHKKLYPLPEGFILMIPTKIMPFIFNGLFTIKGKLTMILDLVKPKGKPDVDESLGSFVKRRLGQEALDKIAEPLVAGVHAGNPETMSVRSSFPKFVEMEQKYGSLIKGMLKARSMAKKAPAPAENAPTMFLTLKDGLVELVDKILENIDKKSILTNTEVENITKNPDDNLYTVKLKNAESIQADSIILSTPAYVSSKLLKDLDVSIAQKLTEIPYVSTATVSLGFKKTDLPKPLDGFGFVIPRTENRKIMAATYSSQKYAHRAPDDSVLIRCFVGGSKNQELVNLSNEEIISLAKSELADILGIKAEPVIARVYKWVNAMPQYVIGHDEKIAWLDERLLKHPGIYLNGSAYKGIGIADSVHNAELVAQEAINS